MHSVVLNVVLVCVAHITAVVDGIQLLEDV